MGSTTKSWFKAALSLVVVGTTGMVLYFLYFRGAEPPLAVASVPLSGDELAPTLEMRELNGRPVPFQNGLPYPTGELQKRESLSLDGEWKKLRLPGNHQLSLSARSPKIIEALERESPEAVDPAFDDGAWASCQIPGVENPAPDRYMDATWYRKSFDLPAASTGDRTILTFEAANYVADVWVNGTWVGSHEGGFTPFSFDVTPHLKKDANLLTVRVDNVPWLPHKKGTATPANNSNIVPYATADWWNYGGLLREVRLESRGPMSIERVEVRSKPEDANTVLDVNVVTRNTTGSKSPVELDLKLYPARITEENLTSLFARDVADMDHPVPLDGAGQKIDLPAEEFHAIASRLEAPPLERWNLRDPRLYVLEARLLKDGRVLDSFHTQFGVREIVTDKTRILVNGRPTFFRGVASHEIFPGENAGDLEGRPEPSVAEALQRDFQNIYDLNANFLRTGHRPAHPLTLLMADRLGIGVWEEVPVYWFGGKELDYQRAIRPVARQMFLEMIARDINRPSILVWGTCNECGAQKERLEFIRDLREHAAKYDASRLLTQSAAGNDAFDRTHDACDFLGFTSYYGVFYGHTYGEATAKALEAMHAAHPDKALFATEFGIWSERDLSNSETQVKCCRETYREFAKKPYVAGSIWWALNDWHTMITDPQSMGLVTFQGARKPVYYALQELYAERDGRAFLKWYSPLQERPIRGNLKVDLEMVSPSPFKSLSVRLDDKPLPAAKVLKDGRFVFEIDSTTLAEGHHILLARAENQAGTVLSQERRFFVDNVDEPPALEVNLKSGDFVLNGQLLHLNATDDRGIAKAEIQLDELPWRTLEPLYRPGVFVTHLDFPAGSAHKLRIRITDSGKQLRESTLSLRPADAAKFEFLDLAFNRDWISSKDNLADGTGWDFPAEELPASKEPFVFNSKGGPILFRFGDKADGAKNSLEARGQTLRLPAGSFKAIHILGTMHDGITPVPIQITHEEGLPRTTMLSLSDWWRGDPIYGEETVVRTAYHHERAERQKAPGTGIYLQTIPIRDGRPQSITLPNDSRLVLFAISLEKQ